MGEIMISLITNADKKMLISRAYTTSAYSAPSRFRVGINQTGSSVLTTALTLQVPITGTEAVDSCDATTGWTAGTDSAVSLNTTTFKEGTGSLNIYKTGTAGTVFSASKTTTSRDFTSKRLDTWIYILDKTDLVSTGTAVVIRFGSDSSNYYYINVAIGSLSNGWNLITYTSATATGTTGTPTIAASDYYYIAFNTDLAADTVAAGRIIIDDLKVCSADDFYKTFAVGYPSIDETNFQATMYCFLNATEANGYLINGLLIENSDASPLVIGADEFTGESKSNTDEFVFIVKDRVI